MVTGSAPFTGLSEIQVEHNISHKMPVFCKDVCPVTADLIICLLDKNPTKRLNTASKIKAHRFFNRVDFDQLKASFKPKLQSSSDTRYFN